jgi:hypothetical protein
MEDEEERTIHQDESHQNLQTETGGDEPNREEQH